MIWWGAFFLSLKVLKELLSWCHFHGFFKINRGNVRDITSNMRDFDWHSFLQRVKIANLSPQVYTVHHLSLILFRQSKKNKKKNKKKHNLCSFYHSSTCFWIVFQYVNMLPNVHYVTLNNIVAITWCWCAYKTAGVRDKTERCFQVCLSIALIL